MMDQICGNNDISNVDVCIQTSCDTGVDHYFCFEIIDQNLCADCCIDLTNSRTDNNYVFFPSIIPE